MKSVGIDYSITSPAVCIHDGKQWHIDNCKFYFITSVKKRVVVIKNKIFGTEYPDYRNNPERFDFLSNWVFKCIGDGVCDNLAMEGYSLGSKGKVFNLAENMGILKHKFHISNIPFIEVPPKSLKKYATGSGNASKEMMFQSFLEETGFDLNKLFFDDAEKIRNPVNDMVDAFYIAKWCHHDI
jgi:Holliday junction resolvasome RuvABC endonuclease subunit